MIRFLDLPKQYQSIRDEIDRAMQAVIHDAAFINGPYVTKFEKEFAAFQKVQHVIGVANGTDAIEIALEALDLPKGSEVIVPANSFIATSEAITRSGFKVVFCDCSENYTLSVEDLSKKITKQTSAVIVVHLYGQPADMDSILNITRKHGLKVIEDAAQAHGGEYKGTRVGNFGDVATFSFYPGKNLGAYGDAGAILANDAALAERMRKIANHGRIAKYNHEFEGRNSRMDGLQGAILSVKLKHLESWVSHRIKIAAEYRRLLKDCPGIILPPDTTSWSKHVYHLFVIRTDKRDALQKYLHDQGIETGIHYPIALPKLQAYQYIGPPDMSLFANRTDTTLLSLPIGEHLDVKDIGTITSAIRQFFGS